MALPTTWNFEADGKDKTLMHRASVSLASCDNMEKEEGAQNPISWACDRTFLFLSFMVLDAFK